MVLGHDVLTSERTQDVKISEDISFDSMLLSPNTMLGLKTSGFFNPSPIQLHGIPLGKCGFDLLLEAKSGTGKTAVFSVIALEKLNLDKGIQTLVLAPTREIAFQICDVIKTIGAHFIGLSVEVVIGGLPHAEDVQKFNKKVHIVVGSPGRLRYLIHGKHIDVSSVRLMVLDEADKLVGKSFLPDINYIFSQLPSQKQIIMSSATYPENIRTVMSNYVQNAHHICPDSNSVLLGIEQNVLVVPSHVNIVKQTKYKYEELNKILSRKQFKQCLVFCNYQVRVGEVQKMLNKDKWPADKLHAKQKQTDRLEALKILQEYQCRILVTTDLAARGIDASNVDLVINFEKPYDWQTYLHRIGRAGRFGSYGSAITILSEGDEKEKFKKLLQTINIPFNLKYLWTKEPFQLNSPNIDKNCQNKEEKLQCKIKESEKKMGIKESYEELWKKLSINSTQTEEKVIHDIPTFESLCESFNKATIDPQPDKIETFSDLMSSFQNHEIKSKEKFDYKHVEVNKFIIPCTVFNRNLVLQRFQKYERAVEKNENDYKCDKPNVFKHAHNEKGTQDYNSKACNSDSNKINSESSYTEDDDSSEKRDKELSNDNIQKESSKSKCNGNASKDNLFESSQDNINFPTASTSSTYKAKTSKNRSINNNSKRSMEHKVRMPNKTMFSKTNDMDNQEFQDESNYNSHQSDSNANANEESDYYNSMEYNDGEKSLLAANLPIAFGKSIQKNYIKLKKQGDASCSKAYSNSKKNNRKSEYGVQLPTNHSVVSRTRQDHVYESSDEDKSEEESVSYRLSRGKESSKLNTQRHNVSDRPRSISNYNGNRYISRVIERQQEFDLWYQQLQAHMQLIETCVYNEVMSNPFY